MKRAPTFFGLMLESLPFFGVFEGLFGQFVLISFRSYGGILMCAFFIIEHKSRRVVHMGVTRSPTDSWVAQQLREATPYGQVPKYLICDNENKFGSCFARGATTSAREILKTPYHAPRASAHCERFMRSVRQACLNHSLIRHEKQLQRILQWYGAYFNRARAHQGIQQKVPQLGPSSRCSYHTESKVIAVPRLGGLHHDYQRVA